MTFWNTLYQYTYARGFIRLPIVLTVPLVYNKWCVVQWEHLFSYWNSGHNQADIWDRLEKKIAAMREAGELE